MQNLNRPISSYHRQNGKRDEIDCKSDNNMELVTPESLISKLNSHINKNKLKKSDLLDNSCIYLDMDDFKELFKRIRFETNQNELNCLFKFRNNSFDEGYLYGKAFLENLNLADDLHQKHRSENTHKTFEVEENELDSSPDTRVEIKEIKGESIKQKQLNKQLKEIKDMKKPNKEKIDFNEINNQLKLIQNEVHDIVQRDKSVGVGGNPKGIFSKKAAIGNNQFDNSRKFSARNISSRNDISSSNTSEVRTTYLLSKNLLACLLL